MLSHLSVSSAAMAEQEQSAAAKATAATSDPAQQPIQLSTISRANSIDDEDLDKAIDELERTSSRDTLDSGQGRG